MHEAEQLTAVVQETTFRNEDNGYTVLRVGSGRSQQTVVGVMPELSPGENVTFEGYWTEHPVYGRQFNARACAITPPTGKSAIEKYLGSGLIRGIGPATAKLIVNRFGEKALDILDEQPQRLTELPGIGPKKAAMIADGAVESGGEAYHFATKEEAIRELAGQLAPNTAMLVKASHAMHFEWIVEELCKAYD